MSFGQKMHSPGQGNGLVSTVTGVTPDIVRTGFMRSRSTTPGSNGGRPSVPANSRYAWISSFLLNRPRPSFGYAFKTRSSPSRERLGSRTTACKIVAAAREVLQIDDACTHQPFQHNSTDRNMNERQ